MRGFFKPVRVGQWENLVTKHQPRGPYCQTCKHWILEEPYCDACYQLGPSSQKWGIQELEPTIGMPKSSVLVRVYCHGTEEVQRIDLGATDWNEKDLERAIKRARFFVPKEKVQA